MICEKCGMPKDPYWHCCPGKMSERPVKTWEERARDAEYRRLRGDHSKPVGEGRDDIFGNH